MQATTAAQRARRQRILQAALALLQEETYDRIQIRDVAIRAEVALGTLYRYFPSKEQLFAFVLLEWSRSFEEAVRRRAPDRDTDAERLRLVLRRAVGAFERYPTFFQLITVLEVAQDPSVREPFAEHNRRFSAALADAIPDTEEADVPVVVDLAVSLLGSLLRGWWLGHHSIRSVRARLDHAVDLLFVGARQR